MIVAIERMTYEGWSTDKALAEAERNGMRRHQVWMRDYARDYGERVHKVGPETMLKSPGAGDDFDDRVGVGMRVVEREASRARKFGGRFLRRVPGAIGSWFGGF
jgi:hypothetical protein